MKFRSALVPVVNFCSNAWIIIFMLGLLMGAAGGTTLMKVGIIMFAAVLLFQLVTLPVEFDASRRGSCLPAGHGNESGRTVRRVLGAARLRAHLCRSGFDRPASAVVHGPFHSIGRLACCFPKLHRKGPPPRGPFPFRRPCRLRNVLWNPATVKLIGEVSEVNAKAGGYKAVYFTVKDAGAFVAVHDMAQSLPSIRRAALRGTARRADGAFHAVRAQRPNEFRRVFHLPCR